MFNKVPLKLRIRERYKRKFKLIVIRIKLVQLKCELNATPPNGGMRLSITFSQQSPENLLINFKSRHLKILFFINQLQRF